MRCLSVFCRIAWAIAVAQFVCAGADLELPLNNVFLGFNAKDRKFTAAIDSAPLKKVMAKMSATTGWKVYIDPAAQHTVSAQFTNRSAGDALRLLLGGLNFALVPQKDGPAKLMVFQDSARDATELVEGAREKKAAKDLIKNELIVSLSRNSKRDIDALAKSLGARIVERNDKLRSYRLQFDSEDTADSARNQLASAPDVRADDNYYVRPPDNSGSETPAGPPEFNLKPDAKPDGSHTIVAVVDTAVQNLPADKTQFLLPAINVAGATDPSALASDVPLHGTSMVETLLGAMATVDEGRRVGTVDSPALSGAQQNGSTSVRILPVNVYGNSETTTTYDVTMGVYNAVKSGATIVNLSLGGDGDSPLLDDLIAQARQQGVIFFAAAGNTPTTDPTFPAANPAVYAVTAADPNGAIASYANRGSFIDLIAPGDSYMDFAGQTFRVTGTSPATATVSGAAAMYLSAGHTMQETQAALQHTFGYQQQPSK